MEKLIRFSMKNAGAMILAIVMIIAGGFYSASTMKLEEMPNVDIPYLSVSVVYPGATPEQVLNDVGKPMEQGLSGLSGLKNLYVTSRSNVATVLLEFDMNQSMSVVEKDLSSALGTIKLPDGVQKPVISKNGPGAVPIFTFAITAPTDQATIQQFVNDQVKPIFSTIPGIASVDVNGLSDKKLFIRLDPDKLKSQNLTVDKVKQALMANNISIPAGQVEMDGKNLNIEVGKKITSMDDLKNTNIVIIEQDMSGMTNAFTSIGQGMSSMGSAMGKLGQGVGQLTKAQMLLQGELEVMQGINGLSSALFADQSTLAGLQGQAQANPQMKGQLDPQIKALQAKIQQEQTQITSLQGKLTSLQQQAKAAGMDVTNILQGMSQSGMGQSSGGAPSTGAGIKMKVIPLSSIADVTYGAGKDLIITRLNGKPAIIAGIKSQPGTNTVEIIKQANEKLDKLSLPTGYQLQKLQDSSVSILKSVNGMLREALLGALFAVLVTLLFLRNLRSTLVAIISIPLSIFASIIFLRWLDYSLNTMTLAGMAVAVGRVVDDSIVVIENIYRRLRNSQERNANVILQAVKEVGGAVTSSTITTVAVFAPLSFVSGIVGKFFVPFAVTVVVAILFSLVIALTVVPLMARLFLLNIEPHEVKENGMQRVYRKLLTWSLNYRKTVIVAALLLFAGSMALIPFIPKNFLPADKTDSYGLKVSLPVGTATSRCDMVAQKVEGILQVRKDVKNYQTNVSGENVSIQIKLIDTVTKADNQKFEKEMQNSLATLGTDVKSALTPQGMATGGGGLIIVVNGSDLATLKKAGDQIVTAIKGTPGLADVDTNLAAGSPQISVDVDPVKAAEKGLNPAMVAAAVRQMVDGDTVTNVNLNGRTTEINLGINVGKLSSISQLADQQITNMSGEQVKVSDVATVSEKPGPSSIQRLNQQEYVSVSGRFTTDNTSQVQKLVEDKIKTLTLPKGVSYYFEGEAQSISEGFTNMTIAILAAILLVYMVMMIAFGEMIAPLAILFSLPFIFVGGLGGMFLFNQSLGMPALVGFLMLIGIVVTNAIVFVDRALRNRKKGMEMKEALIEAGVTRIRPILMTAVATIGALLPLAILGEGGLISRSLAIVVISGLTTSTILTLVIVPVAYYILDKLRTRLYRGKKHFDEETC